MNIEDAIYTKRIHQSNYGLVIDLIIRICQSKTETPYTPKEYISQLQDCNKVQFDK